MGWLFANEGARVFISIRDYYECNDHELHYFLVNLDSTEKAESYVKDAEGIVVQYKKVQRYWQIIRECGVDNLPSQDGKLEGGFLEKEKNFLDKILMFSDAYGSDNVPNCFKVWYKQSYLVDKNSGSVLNNRWKRDAKTYQAKADFGLQLLPALDDYRKGGEVIGKKYSNDTTGLHYHIDNNTGQYIFEYTGEACVNYGNSGYDSDSYDPFEHGWTQYFEMEIKFEDKKSMMEWYQDTKVLVAQAHRLLGGYMPSHLILLKTPGKRDTHFFENVKSFLAKWGAEKVPWDVRWRCHDQQAFYAGLPLTDFGAEFAGHFITPTSLLANVFDDKSKFFSTYVDNHATIRKSSTGAINRWHPDNWLNRSLNEDNP